MAKETVKTTRLSELEETALYQIIARKIKAARKAKNLSLQKLAAAAGVSKATTTNIELGYMKPRLEVIIALARALRLDFHVLLPTQAGEIPAYIKAKGGKLPKPGAEGAQKKPAPKPAPATKQPTRKPAAKAAPARPAKAAAPKPAGPARATVKKDRRPRPGSAESAVKNLKAQTEGIAAETSKGKIVSQTHPPSKVVTKGGHTVLAPTNSADKAGPPPAPHPPNKRPVKTATAAPKTAITKHPVNPPPTASEILAAPAPPRLKRKVRPVLPAEMPAAPTIEDDGFDMSESGE